MPNYEQRLKQLESLGGDRTVSYAWATYEYGGDGECVAVTLNGKNRTERRQGEANGDLLDRAYRASGYTKAIIISWLGTVSAGPIV